MMSAEHNRITELAVKYLRNDLSAQETAELEQWKNESAENAALFSELLHPEAIRKGVAELHAADTFIRQRLEQEGVRMQETAIVAPMRKNRFLYWGGWAAACVLLIAGSVAIFRVVTPTENRQAETANASSAASVPPGKYGAVLTLADGSQVVLDSMDNQVISTQKGAKLVVKDHQLAYVASGEQTDETTYNTVTTPRGRHFKIVLPDGSQVWLNSASTLRFPTVFTGKERAVKVSGEAYFEVVSKAGAPFRVNVNGQEEIEVLGTRFNVTAYENEHTIRTTLLEGSVAIRKNGRRTILKPGEQAKFDVTVKSGAVSVAAVEAEHTAVWRNGVFNFEGATLEEVMNQLSRWYDIKIVYEKQVPDIRFGGEMSRDISLEGLLRTLEASEVHYRLEDKRTLIISP